MNTPSLPVQAPGVQNRLLRALPSEVLGPMLPLLEEVPLAAGERVVTAGEPIPHAWFFESGLASVMLHTTERGSYETLVVGRYRLSEALRPTAGPRPPEPARWVVGLEIGWF